MSRVGFWKMRKYKKRLKKLSENRLQNLRFSYEVAKDILKDSSIRYYNKDDVEILDAKKLRLEI